MNKIVSGVLLLRYPHLLVHPIRLRDQIFFSKRLSFLLSAGVPLIESLTLIRIQTRNRSHAERLEKVIDDVANGQYLSASLERSRLFLDGSVIHTIRAGETTGSLGPNLAHLAEELAKKEALRRKIFASLLYPAFITVSTLAICVLLTVYIFPRIIPIFESLDATLPVSTRVLMAVSSYLSVWGGITVLVLLAAVIAGVVAYRRIERIRSSTDAFLLRVPFFGTLTRDYQLAAFARSSNLMLAGGVPLLRTLELAGASATHASYRSAYREISERIAAGETLSASLSRFPHLFPPFLTHLLAVGERTGKLPESLEYLERFYEGEVDVMTKHLSSSIEPALMLAMGLVVGFIAISIITPIYEITQHVRTR